MNSQRVTASRPRRARFGSHPWEPTRASAKQRGNPLSRGPAAGRDGPMWLHRARIPQVAAEMVRALMEGGDIETESPREVQADIEAVLTQYLADDQEINDRAKDLIATRGMPQSELGRMK